MNIQHRPFFLLSLLVLALVPSLVMTAAPQQTAEEFIEKHLAASGGRDAIAKVTSRRATGTVTVATPGGDLTGPMEILHKAPNKSRVHVVLDLTPLGVNDKMTIEEKFDGAVGWALNSMQGDTQISGNRLDNMKNAMFPSPLLNYKSAGAKIEMQPREDVAGKSLVVLLLTPKAGSAIRMYFDPDTLLLARTRATINTPEMGDLEQIGEVSDYRTVDGIKIPFQIVNTNSAQTVTLKFQKVEHNVAIDDAVFSVKKP